ncbi:hypothetical protein NHG34_08600 [Aerococcaceae bacterium NML190938]|nr:hypothetical protein [Aerococcaceae bacterium NML190938]
MTYEKTLEIEVLSEYAHNVYNAYSRFLTRNNIDVLNEKESFHGKLFDVFAEMLSVTLYDKNETELNEIRAFWQHMDSYVKVLNTQGRIVE